MDTNAVSGTVEDKPFEEMRVYFDHADGHLILGKTLNALVCRAIYPRGSDLPSTKLPVREATEAETLAYWASVVAQVEEERRQFEESITRLTGHQVEIKIGVWPHFAQDYAIFDAALLVDGFHQEHLSTSKWATNNTPTWGKTTVYGPIAVEEP